MPVRFFTPFREAGSAVARRARALPAWSAYIALALLVVAGAAFYILRYGLRRQIDAGSIANNTQLANRVDNLWFLPDGRLVSTQRDQDGLVLVSTWQADGSQLKRAANKKSFELSKVLNLLEELETQDKNRPRDGWSIPQYAIARDGSKAAVYLDGYLAIVPADTKVTSPQDLEEIELVSKPADAPLALSITDNGLIALGYPNGKIEFRDSERLYQVVGTAQTKLTGPSIMKPWGNFLAVVSPINAAVVLLDLRTLTKETPLHGYPPSPVENFTLAISDNGGLAIATGSSKVLMTQPDGTGDASLPLEAYGTVKILSFYDNERIIAGGEFQNLYVLSRDQLPAPIAIVPNGVNALAVSNKRIAYAGEDGLFLMWHTTKRLPSMSGKIVFLVGSVVVIVLVILSIRDARKREDTSPVAHTPGEEFRPLPDPPSDLVEACAAGECVLYAGAGLSARSGLPLWKDFVHGLLEWAVENHFLERGDATSFHAEIDSGDADPVADTIISRLNNPADLSALNNYLQRIFLKSASPSKAHFLLRRTKFSAILTTNFDNLLERQYQSNQIYTPTDSEALLTALTKRDFFVLKLYGTLDKPETVIVAPAQYEGGITGNKTFSQFMQTLFVSRTLLFVGASLEGIEAYLKGISLPKETGRRHYALIAVSGYSWRAKADLLERRYGIKVLPFTPGNDYAELNTFLQKLAFKVAAEPAATVRQRQTSSRLKRFSLENIGPFESLTLSLDPNLMVFLGDNGVGKSTILKALAFGLCGDEAEEHAWRLLRSGCSRGRIVLETDNRTSYVTEIERDEKTGVTTVLANTAQPLVAEGWLAIGFPPLRTTSWTPPKGPEADYKPPSRPMAEDLIPIVTGDVDPRLDDLKQWIVTQDYRSAKSDSKGKDDIYRRLIEKVFEGVARVTEGMKISYGGVDSSNRIVLKTEDGDHIPLEGLSQGTISLIGWVGILMQRLFEIYATDEDPTRRYALVLMDEIDAHMHPAWQRTLLNHLREIFPQVQLIVTTHSPLVIGGLPVNQVTRFARDAKGKVVMLPIEPDMTLGYSDQILTSLLFGLPTSLDSTTERKQKRYYELFEMPDRGGHSAEYEQLKQELMARVPPPSASYDEKHQEQLTEANMLKTLGEKLKRSSPERGQILIERGEKLRLNIEGSRHND